MAWKQTTYYACLERLALVSHRRFVQTPAPSSTSRSFSGSTGSLKIAWESSTWRKTTSRTLRQQQQQQQQQQVVFVVDSLHKKPWSSSSISSLSSLSSLSSSSSWFVSFSTKAHVATFSTSSMKKNEEEEASSGVIITETDATTTSSGPIATEPKTESGGGVLLDACGNDDDDDDDEMEQEEMFVEAYESFEYKSREWGGPRRGGRFLEPTRFGDWERKGRCSDF